MPAMIRLDLPVKPQDIRPPGRPLVERIAGVSSQGTRLSASTIRIPVHSRYGVEFVDARRAMHLGAASNAEVVRRRDGRVMRIQLHSFGDDLDLPGHKFQDKDMIHSHETATNPPRVWEHEKPCLA